MSRGPVSWAQAGRAAIVALLLLGALAFAAANFVLVDVHVLALSVQTRLAWVVLGPAALTFAFGVRYGRTSGRGSDG
jgi:hypothetical protein